jgi:hypothetical protein
MVIRMLLILLALAGAARADSLRIVVGAETPVVGEMIPVTIRGEYTSLITLETFVFPNSDDYDWIQITTDGWADEQIGGRTVRVFEQHIALFPRRPGPITIGPVTHHLTIVGRKAPREEIDVPAEAVTVEVAPYPVEGPPITAHGITVKDELSAEPGALRDGETLTRRVTITAKATLPHLLPTRPAMREPWLITFASPEDRKTELTPDGPVTTIVWEWSLRPRTGEPGVLAGMKIPWFDTGARTMRTAEIPPIPFGYASFGSNQGGADRLAPRAAAFGYAAVGAGLVVGLGFAVSGLALRGRAEAMRMLRRLSPVDPTRRVLVRAARSGDPLAIRRAADRHLRRRADLGRVVHRDETAELDRAVYGPPGDPAAPTASEAALAMLRRRRRR